MILKNGKIFRDGRVEKKDVRIIGKHIAEIGDNLDGNASVYDVSGCLIIPGAVDVHAHLREPGFEYKETIATGTYSAAAGGITTVMAMPNTNPVVDSIEHYNDVKGRIEHDAIVSVYPFGAVTYGEKGTKLADIKDLLGKVKGFSDDGVGFKNLELLKSAMELIKNKSIIASHAEAKEYKDSREAEYKAVERELKLVKETGCKYHFCHMSCAESFELIKKAQKEGLDVTCEVTPHHLFMDEDMIKDNPNFKMAPPLRNRDDREATVNALLKGVATIIATDHAPHSDEEKSRPYDEAPNGIIGFETMLPLVYTRLIRTGVADISDMIDWCVINPAKRFNLPYSTIDVGQIADVAVLDIEHEREYKRNDIISKSHNSPYIGEKLFGYNVLTVRHGKVIYKY